MTKKLGILFTSALLFLLPVAVFAQSINGSTWFQGVLTNFLNIVVWPIFIGAILIMIVYAGFLFLTAAGDPTKVATARKAALWAVIGIAVGILAFSAYATVQKILKV